MITFSSDEELVEALGSISGDVFRVYVKVDENSKQDATMEDSEYDRGNFRSCTLILVHILNFVSAISLNFLFCAAIKNAFLTKTRRGNPDQTDYFTLSL